jgi:single-stranded-DNA-specific exonuclease
MIGTIADMMPLIDENQAFVNLGIAQLKQTKNLGLKKILQHSNLEQINETAIAFKIAPKINSSGRMNKAKDAVALLVTNSDAEANRLILEIEQNHLQRKDLTDEAYLLCESLLNPDDSVLVVAHEKLHEGIIGICAQKLVEKYQKTTCVIYIDEQGVGKGSMRAFGEDNALELLQANHDLLNRFGGHSQAAGLQLPEQNIDTLRARMNKEPKAYIKPTMKIDMEIRLQDIELKTIVELEAYSFFTAKFLISSLVVKSKTKMSEKHTKLVVSDGLKLYDAVLFNNLEYYYLLAIGDVVDIVGGLSVNTWRNVSKVQILIKDLRCNQFQAIDFRQQAHYVEALQNVTKPIHTALINDISLLQNELGLSPFKGELPHTVWVLPTEGQPDLDKYVTRAGLLEFYRLMQTVDQIPKTRLALKTKIHPALLDRILDIFVELALVKVRDDVVHYIPTHIRQDLEGAKAFAKLKQIAAAVKTIYHLEQDELKSHLQSLLEA